MKLLRRRGRPRQAVPTRALSARRVFLGLVIAATSVLPLVFVRYDEPSTTAVIYRFLAKTGAFVGSMFLVWQFFLGFRGAVSSVFEDLSWVVELHKKLGQYGMLVIPLHPVFIGLYYLTVMDVNIYALDLQSDPSRWTLVGIILLGLIVFIVVSSAFFRQKLGFYRWLYTHLSSYLVPPLLFAHSFMLGSTVQATPVYYLWWGLIVLMGLLYLYRFAHRLGVFAARYRVKRAAEVARNTTEILMEPAGDGLRPAPGQFVYLRRNLSDNAHPYTVSSYDDDSGLLGVTVKEDGPQTSALQDARAGDVMILDGPFGVFTRVARAAGRPIVMIAGGIGITPFRRLWRALEGEKDREAWLFYGNEIYEDIAYREELDSLKHVRVVHVLNQEPDFPGEKGFITVKMLRRRLSRELAEHQFFICGPPVMVTKLEAELQEAPVPHDHVQHELFAT